MRCQSAVAPPRLASLGRAWCKGREMVISVARRRTCGALTVQIASLWRRRGLRRASGGGAAAVGDHAHTHGRRRVADCGTRCLCWQAGRQPAASWQQSWRGCDASVGGGCEGLARVPMDGTRMMMMMLLVSSDRRAGACGASKQARRQPPPARPRPQHHLRPGFLGDAASFASAVSRHCTTPPFPLLPSLLVSFIDRPHRIASPSHPSASPSQRFVSRQCCSMAAHPPTLSGGAR